MPSMRDIQRRKNSIQSTEQITKAMKLVATVRLQKARTKAEEAKPYFEKMYSTINSILAHSYNPGSKYLLPAGDKKKAFIVITANRGLAGGYNANVVKLITKNDEFTPDNTIIYNIGKKGREILNRNKFEIKADYSDVVNEPIYRDAIEICEDILKDYENGEFGELYIAYTKFKNTVVHTPELLKILPIGGKDELVNMTGEENVSEADKITFMKYEPSEEEVLDRIIPNYITSLIFGTLNEAVASENGARMTAMDSATSNADEMIANLSLLYNRARQSSITQELTEIIAGADAIS